MQANEDQRGEKFPRKISGSLAMSNYQLCFFPRAKQEAFPPVALAWFRMPLGSIATITVC